MAGVELFEVIIYAFVAGITAGIWGAWFYSKRL